MPYTSKELPFDQESVPGISGKTLAIHHDKLYVGYVNKKNEIQEKLEAVDLDSANATFSPLRSLKAEETFAVNAVYLHEYYFGNLGGNGTPSGILAERIAKDFGTVENWQKTFAACGMVARGWVVTAWDTHEERLRIYCGDTHNQGGVWGSIPIITLDVFEHAYFIDYGSDRKAYIEAYLTTLNWDDANERFEKFALQHHH